MKWVIDKMEENIVLLENIETKEKKEVNTSLLPSSIHEGSVLTLKDGIYYLEEAIEFKRRTEILEQFKRLRSNRD